MTFHIQPSISFSILYRSKEILTEGNFKLNYSPGGSTQNTLKTISVKCNRSSQTNSIHSYFQWLLGQANLTVCMGCIGQDESGRKLEEQMENCLYQKTSNLPTGTCLILITDQARWILFSYLYPFVYFLI